MSSETIQARILLIDDSPSIHDDFRRILCPKDEADVDSAMAELLSLSGEAGVRSAPSRRTFDLVGALQGQEGLAKLQEAKAEARPFSVVFVDMRMPPGWNGVETIAKLWEHDSEIQTVVCTAYSDISWDETIAKLGESDRLLILKKPFDAVEIYQLACALSSKWMSTRHENELIESLRRAEAEARTYACSLETVNRALSTAKSSAEKVADLRRDFLVRMSDELHRSVTSIFSLVEGARSGQRADQALESLDSISTVTSRLMATFSQTLDLTLAETGKSVPQLSQCSVREVLTRTCQPFAEKAQGKGLSFAVRVDENIPALLRLDAFRFAHVLSELVDNAVTFTKEGSITLSARLCCDVRWGASVLRIDVTDTGPGIPQDRLGWIFEPFYSHAPRPDGQPGLGLSLAKQLAQQLGGDVSVESHVGRGSTFTLTVEISDAACAPA